MKHNKILLLAGGVLAATSLVGCGQQQTGSGKIRITFDHTFGESIEKAVIARFNTFKGLVEKEEGVKLELVMNNIGSYNAVVNTVGMELQSGNGPTMTVAYPDHVAALQHLEKTRGQYIVAMDKYMDDEKIGFGKEEWMGDRAKYSKDDIIQSYLEEGQQFDKAGTTYCLPYLKSTEVLQYNIPKVKAALDYYPKTQSMDDKDRETFLNTMSFEELMELADVIVKNKSDLKLGDLTYPVFYDSDSNMVITQMIQRGLTYSGFDNSGNVVLGLDKSVASMADNYAAAKTQFQKYREWHNAGLLSTKSVLGGYSSTSFKNQECVFVIGSTGGAGYSVPEAGSFEAGYVRVPYVGENKLTPDYVSQGVSIAFCNDKSVSKSVNEQRIKYAWKFYKYLILPSNNIAIACNNSMGYVPVRTSAYSTNEWAKVTDPEDEEDITYYTHTANVVESLKGHFFNTAVFNGSDKYRTFTTDIVTQLMKTNDSIDDIVAAVVTRTKNYMDGKE